jgi:hypothetical protein
MARSVISRSIGVIAELNTIIKIHKYKGLYEKHHFIRMAMEVRGAPRCDMDCFFRECVHFLHIGNQKAIYPLFFCINFLRQHVNIAFQHALDSIIERKIMLTRDAYSKAPIFY